MLCYVILFASRYNMMAYRINTHNIIFIDLHLIVKYKKIEYLYKNNYGDKVSYCTFLGFFLVFSYSALNQGIFNF